MESDILWRLMYEKNTDAQRHLPVIDVSSTQRDLDPIVSKSDNSCSTF